MLGEDVVSLLMRGYSIKVAAAELGVERYLADAALKRLREQEGCKTTIQLVCKLKRRIRERDRVSRADYMKWWRLVKRGERNGGRLQGVARGVEGEAGGQP